MEHSSRLPLCTSGVSISQSPLFSFSMHRPTGHQRSGTCHDWCFLGATTSAASYSTSFSCRLRACVFLYQASDVVVETDSVTGNADELAMFLTSHGGGSITPGTEPFGVAWHHSVPVFTKVDAASTCEDERAEIIFTATDHCGNNVSTVCE